MQNITQNEGLQPVYLITTKRAQQLARYPDHVSCLTALLGISHGFAADPSIEVRTVILSMLGKALLAEREKRSQSYWQYSFDRNMDLAEAFGTEWTGIMLRKPELTLQQYQAVFVLMPQEHLRIGGNQC